MLLKLFLVVLAVKLWGASFRDLKGMEGRAGVRSKAGEGSAGLAVRLLVLYFSVRHMEEGVSAPAMNMKLAGLAFLFKLQGQPDFTKDFGVRQAIKGYRRSVVRRDARRPVTFVMMRGMVAHLGECVDLNIRPSFQGGLFVSVLWGV